VVLSALLCFSGALMEDVPRWRTTLRFRWLKAKADRAGNVVLVTRYAPRNHSWEPLKVEYTWSIPLDLWLSGTLAEMEDYVVKYIRSKDELRASSVEIPVGIDPEAQELFPALMEYLTRAKTDLGHPRKTATLTILVQDGAWKATLNDRETGFQCWVTGGSALEAIRALEAAVCDPRTVWRPNPFAGTPAPQKRKN